MGMRSVREVCIRAETVLKILFCGFWNAAKRSVNGAQSRGRVAVAFTLSRATLRDKGA